VSVVIPHYAGSQLFECLEALFSDSDAPGEVLVVDDASTDGTSEVAKRRYPGIRLLINKTNLGFVGACNRGLAEAAGAYAVLLNDDALPQPDWLRPLLETMERDPQIAACQPKILRAHNSAIFDYAGAAGGLLDRYGYPFALGRWFDVCEADTGQYDAPREIMWASGAAMMLRMSVYREIGGLEPVFQMHMEEIDWCWRARVAGYHIVSVPESRILHYGAATLKAESLRKMYLNHRNSLLLLVKNYELWTLARVLPVRLLLELVTILGGLVTLNWRRALGAAWGLLGAAAALPRILPARARVQRLRRVRDGEIARHLYQGSIVLRWLLRKGAPAEIPGAGA